MLMCVLALCGFGYVYIASGLGVSEQIVGDTTDNATLVEQNSSFYHEGKGLLVGSDTLGIAILIVCILLFIVLILLALRNAGWI